MKLLILRLSKNWNSCIKFLLPLNCLEPIAKNLQPVYLPRTVQEQLRRIFELHSKQLRIMQSPPDSLEKHPHSGDHEQIKAEDDELRQRFVNRIRELKLEQLADYFKFRCDQRVTLHIDSLDMDLPFKQQNSQNAVIDRFLQEM